MQLYIQTTNPGPAQPATPPQPLTPVRKTTGTIFTAPVTDPFGATRRGTVHAASLGDDGQPDGLWEYERREGDLPWCVTYVPTGQHHRFSSLDNPGGARAATATWLLDEFRGDAYVAAFRAETASRRRDGQRLLALHLRAAGDTTIDRPCGCGGLLRAVKEAEVKVADQLYAHVDACESCREDMAAGCAAARDHRFCGRPDPLLTDLECRVIEFERKWWQRPGGKVAAIRQEFGGMSEITYYAVLNRAIDQPAALRVYSTEVGRLRRLRSARTRSTN